MTSVDKAAIAWSIAIVAVGSGFAIAGQSFDGNVSRSGVDDQSSFMIGGVTQQSTFMTGGVSQQGILQEGDNYITIDPAQMVPLRSSSETKQITVSGVVDGYNRGSQIFLEFEQPDGSIQEFSLIASKKGEFSTIVMISGDFTEEGEYKMTVIYNRKEVATANLVLTNNPVTEVVTTSKISDQCELGSSRCETCIESTSQEQFTCTRDFRDEVCGGTKICNINNPIKLPSTSSTTTTTTTSSTTSTLTASPTASQCNIGDAGCQVCVDPNTLGGFPCDQAYRDLWCSGTIECNAPPTSTSSLSSQQRSIKQFEISDKRVIVYSGQPTLFTISGHVPNVNTAVTVDFDLYLPDASLKEFSVKTDLDGYFALNLDFEITDQQGRHKVSAEGPKGSIGEQTFTVEHHVAVETGPKIPSWIKTNVQWWADGAVPDSTFVDGIEFLISEDIIHISDLPESSAAADPDAEITIPAWIKNNGKWWTEEKVSDDDFINGLKYLVEQGIIQVN